MKASPSRGRLPRQNSEEMTEKDQKMYLFGASGHGKVVAEIAEKLELKIKAFVDQDRSKKELSGYEVIHEVLEPGVMFIAIGNNRIRKKIAEQYAAASYPMLIHPKTAISERVVFREGTVVMAGVSVNPDVKIGRHCIINTNASIDHDCVLEDFVHISPNAALAGDVKVGEGTHVGIGACIIQGITIGKWCTIGAGTVVIRNVPDGTTVVGNPGRITRST